MGKIELLCSSGAFIGRKNGRNHKLFLAICRQLRADGFEFMMYDSWYDKMDGIVSDFKERGLYTPVLHADKMIGHQLASNDINQALQNFEHNCRIARSLNAKKLVLHLWNGPSLDDNIETNISALSELYDISASYGVTLTVENVVCKKSNPLDLLFRITEKYENATFTFDTKMAAFHQSLDGLYRTDYSWLWDRVSHLHVNDYAGTFMDWTSLKTLHIGCGDIDFSKFFTFINGRDYSGTLTLECTSMGENCELYPEKMNESIKKVRKFLVQEE